MSLVENIGLFIVYITISGDHLLEALCIGTTKEQQEQYSKKVQRRIYSGQAKPDEVMTLREHIAKLRRNLQMLEDEGFVTREDGYQALVTSIALDLCNKGKYRQAQRRALATLMRTKQSLLEKTKYYEEKCSSYDQYIKSCLANLHAGKRCVIFFGLYSCSVCYSISLYLPNKLVILPFLAGVFTLVCEGQVRTLKN